MKSVIWLALGTMFGWFYAHHEISIECQYQGNFYVGSTVYNCGVKP